MTGAAGHHYLHVHDDARNSILPGDPVTNHKDKRVSGTTALHHTLASFDDRMSHDYNNARKLHITRHYEHYQGKIRRRQSFLMDQDTKLRIPRHTNDTTSSRSNVLLGPRWVWVYYTLQPLFLVQHLTLVFVPIAVFPEDRSLVRSILCNSPRILRKDVKTHLQPTKQFLQQLYGPEMFREVRLSLQSVE